ncbi:hypothetical protein C8P66_11916 [Humitalea rosea]|uniref:Uncharacterized protein n=1 Tax=Humitalea rosea TaxID=990373 RepID=A0A2W7I634_9PROT|nr:hypothetical protein [Humitalea rosea]PZW42124.1 hypothetical protein C8P66_11916 [Humitalea rosea]
MGAPALLLLLVPGVARAGQDGGTGPLNWIALLGVIGAAALLLAGIALFIRRLQDDSAALVRQPELTADRIAAWREMPAGLPEGTIRAALSIFIVVIGMLTLLAAPWLNLNGNGEIGTIIGSVLGFYFGARQSGGSAEAAPIVPPAAPPAAPPPPAATGTLARAAEALAMARLGAQAAAPMIGPAAGRVISAIEDGLAAAEGAAGGDLAAIATAAGAAERALDAALGPDHPLATVLGDAIGGLRAGVGVGALLGGPAGLMAAVGLGAIQALGAGSDAYDRWKARILDRPFSPRLFPPGEMDGAVLLSALAASGTFARLLLEPLPPEAKLPRARAVADAARLEDAAALAAIQALTPRGDFESPDDLAEALQAYRRRLLDALPGPDLVVDLAPVLGAGAPRLAGAQLADALAMARAAPGGAGVDAAVLALIDVAGQPEATPGRMAGLLAGLLPAATTVAEAGA